MFVSNFLQNIFGGNNNDGAVNGNGGELYDLVIIGGGVSGMASALSFREECGVDVAVSSDEDKAEEDSSLSDKKVLVLEASSTLGGRVQSDVTEDGFIMDRGFAVFIEEYPFAKKLLDYADLELCKFEPGALVYTGVEGMLYKVADPIRRPADLFVALTAPVGEFTDKLKVLPLLFHVFTTSIDDLFKEEEMDTLSCLKERWGFSDKLISEFMQPFLEGIYLAPLKEQSSQMFHFVFKMFSEGYACLPKNGLNAVSAQMASKCKEEGVEFKMNSAVTGIDTSSEHIKIKTNGASVSAKSIVLATEGNIAERLLSGLPSIDSIEEQVQRSVSCLYYTFDSKVPISEPILILNGSERDAKNNPVNNICFPSVVSSNYSPDGENICSVTILKPAMDLYEGNLDDLDKAVRKQISSWFPSEFSDDILNGWVLKESYSIKSAQPAQYGGISPANVNGGKDCSSFRESSLPSGVFVCGDHMATATLNGALESGVNAGKSVASFLEK